MKFTTKLLSGAALAVALMNSANASTVDWSFSGTNSNKTQSASLTFTYDTDSMTFSNALYTDTILGFSNEKITLSPNGTSPLMGLPNNVSYYLTPTEGLKAFDFSSAGQIFSAMIMTQNSVFIGKLTSSATAVPEPEAYAMMLAGLGLVGFAARRKQAV